MEYSSVGAAGGRGRGGMKGGVVTTVTSEGRGRGKMERIANNEKLIPMNMIAYRQQYGSVNPAGIIALAIVATFVSTFVAVVYCKGRNKRQRV